MLAAFQSDYLKYSNSAYHIEHITKFVHLTIIVTVYRGEENVLTILCIDMLIESIKKMLCATYIYMYVYNVECTSK